MAAAVPEQPVRVAVLIRHEQIEIAVAVDVEPDGADAFSCIAYARLHGHVGESIAVVTKQPVPPIAKRDEEIENAVVVVVDPRRVAGAAGDVEAAPRRGAGEMAA